MTLTNAFANHVTTAPIVGGIAYGGSGCPAGSARMEFSQGSDRSSLNFRFDDYSVSTNGRQIDRASCALTIPIQIPRGYALLLPQISLDGVARIENGDQAKLNAEVFVAGSQGSLQTRTLNSANDGVFSFVANADVRQRTACGESINLRMNTSVMLQGNYNSGSYVNVNKMKLRIPLKMVACNQ